MSVCTCENCSTAGVRHDSLTVSISASHCGPAARCRSRFGTYQKQTFKYSGCTQLNAIIFSWLICVFRNIACYKIAFESKTVKADNWPPANRTIRYGFCSCDLDVEPSILIHKVDLNILNVYLNTKMNFLWWGFQKSRALQPDSRTEGINTGGKITYTMHQRSLFISFTTFIWLFLTNYE